MVVATQRIQESLVLDPPNTAASLRVLLDARKIGDGGIGTYIENLLIGLTKEQGINVTAIVNSKVKDKLVLPANLTYIEDNSPLYSLDEMFLMPGRIDFSKFDIFHVPHYTLPYFVPIPSIVTIHDLIRISHPERWYYPYISRTLVRSALNRATKIITVSQSTKEEILKEFGKNSSLKEKIQAVPNMISPRFLNSRSDKMTANNGSSRRNGRYILSVISNLKPHKGLNDLIKAFEIVQEQIRQAGKPSDIKLVIAGQGLRDMDGADLLLKHTESLRGVHLAGEVTSDELRDLYSKALALVVPSTIEGFCMPVIEAHACGVPVITRPVPAVREITTKYDLIAEDMSIDALAAAILKSIDDSTKLENDEIARTLHEELNRFQIDKVTPTLINLYHQAALKR